MNLYCSLQFTSFQVKKNVGIYSKNPSRQYNEIMFLGLIFLFSFSVLYLRFYYKHDACVFIGIFSNELHLDNIIIPTNEVIIR